MTNTCKTAQEHRCLYLSDLRFFFLSRSKVSSRLVFRFPRDEYKKQLRSERFSSRQGKASWHSLYLSLSHLPPLPLPLPRLLSSLVLHLFTVPGALLLSFSSSLPLLPYFSVTVSIVLRFSLYCLFMIRSDVFSHFPVLCLIVSTYLPLSFF